MSYFKKIQKLIKMNRQNIKFTPSHNVSHHLTFAVTKFPPKIEFTYNNLWIRIFTEKPPLGWDNFLLQIDDEMIALNDEEEKIIEELLDIDDFRKKHNEEIFKKLGKKK